MRIVGSLEDIKATAIRIITPGRRPLHPKHKRNILVAAALLLLIGLITAIRQQPVASADLNWFPVVLVIAVGVPLTICLNTADYMLTGRFLGHAITFSRALEVTVIGMAANILPLPGSTLVRVAGLKAEGAGLKTATLAVLIVAALWIGVALAYAGLAILSVAPHPAGIVFAILGSAILVYSMLRLWRMPRGSGLALRLLGVKFALILADAIRLYWCMGALGITATYAQASGLSLSGAVGNMVSVVPAGLGIREAAAAGLGPLVGLTLASGFLAATLNRVLGLATLVPLAAVLVARSRRRTQEEQMDAG